MPVESAPVESKAPGVEPATLVRNSTLMLFGKVYSVVAAGILSVLTVRLLTVDEYGSYSVAMAIILIVAALTELGTSTTVIRAVASDPASTSRVVGTAVVAQLGAAVVGSLVVVPFGLLLGYSHAILILLALGCVLIGGQALFAAVGSVFPGRRVMAPFALATAVQATVSLVFGGGALLLGAGPAGLVVGVAAGYFAAAGSTMRSLRKRLGVRLQLRGAWRDVPRFLRVSIVIAAASSTAIVYGRVDVLLLSKLDGVAAAGIYNLPLTIMEVTMLASGAVSFAFFPLLTQQLADDRASAHDSLDLMWRVYLVGIVPVCLVLAIGSSDIVTTVFGERYRASGSVLTVLAATGVANSLMALAWQALVAGHKEATRIPAVVAGLAVNVVLNLLLIPSHGTGGAAVALLASDVFVATWLAYVVHRDVLAVPFLRLLITPTVVLGAVLLALVAFDLDCGLGWGGIGAAVYVAALLIVRYIRLPELEPLLGPARDLINRARTGTGRSSTGPH